MSTLASISGTPTGVAQASLNMSINRAAPYGPYVNLSASRGEFSSQDAFARYISPYGEVAVRTSSTTKRTDLFGATRIWFSPYGVQLASIGQSNLVLADVGTSGIKVRPAGGATVSSGDDGVAVIRHAAAWTNSTLELDPTDAPLSMRLNLARVQMMLQADRAYRVRLGGLVEHVEAVGAV